MAINKSTTFMEKSILSLCIYCVMLILAASKALPFNSSIGDFLLSHYAQALWKHKEMSSGKEIFSDHSIMTRVPD